jgi:hypothetical protein
MDLAFGYHLFRNRAPQSDHEAVWRNPGNAFGTGCTDWTPKSLCIADLEGPDFAFRLLGNERAAPNPVPALGPLGLLSTVLALAGASIGVLARRRRR